MTGQVPTANSILRRAVWTLALAAAVAAVVLLWTVNGNSESDAVGHRSLATMQQWASKHIEGISPRLVRQACAEGHLQLYALITPGIDEVDKQFEKRFPCVSTSAFTGSGGVISARFLSEAWAHRNIADVLQSTSPSQMNSLIKSDLLAKYAPPTGNRVEPAWRRTGYYYAYGVEDIAVIWNTKNVTEAQTAALSRIHTWRDLLRVPGAGDGAGITDIKAGGTSELPMYYYVKKFGASYLRAIQDRFHPQIFDSITPAMASLAAGQIALMPEGASNTAATDYNEGVPLAWVIPSPTLGVPNSLAISKAAPDPAAARLYEAWSLSAEGQAAYVQYVGVAAANSTVPDHRPFTKQQWYRKPQAYLKPSWAAIGDALPKLDEQFSKVFSG